MRHLFLLFLFLLASLAPLRARQELSDADYLAELRSDAEQGDAEAQHDLGVVYAKGHGVGQDHVEAWKWFLKAAEQGHATAHVEAWRSLRQGLRRCSGSKVVFSKPPSEATPWPSTTWAFSTMAATALRRMRGPEGYLKAAEQGHATAQYNLGGDGVVQFSGPELVSQSRSTGCRRGPIQPWRSLP